MEEYVTREKIRKSIEENIDCLTKEIVEFIFEENKRSYSISELDQLVGVMLVNKLFHMREIKNSDRYMVLAISEELDKKESEIQKKLDKLMKPF